jgi:hypothetical protein
MHLHSTEGSKLVWQWLTATNERRAAKELLEAGTAADGRAVHQRASNMNASTLVYVLAVLCYSSAVGGGRFPCTTIIAFNC